MMSGVGRLEPAWQIHAPDLLPGGCAGLLPPGVTGLIEVIEGNEAAVVQGIMVKYLYVHQHALKGADINVRPVVVAFQVAVGAVIRRVGDK